MNTPARGNLLEMEEKKIEWVVKTSNDEKVTTANLEKLKSKMNWNNEKMGKRDGKETR